MWNSISSILSITSTAVSLIIAILIICSPKRSAANVLLAIAVLLSALWGGSVFATQATSLHWVARIPFAASSLIPAVLMLFAIIFSGRELRWWKAFLIILPAYTISLLSLYDSLLFKDVTVLDGYIYTSEPGILLSVFSVYFVVSLVVLGYMLYRANLELDGIKKVQLKFISAGLTLTIISAATVNLVLPLYGIYKFNHLGPSFTLFISLSMIYAATAHHLLNIRIVLSEIWAFCLVLMVFIWLMANPTVFNLVLFLMVVSISALFVRSILSEADKTQRLQEHNSQLRKDKEELRALDKLKDEFLQMATHELNTPIAVIQGTLSMIVDENIGGFDKRQREMLKPLLDGTRRLSRLSRDLLSVSRIDHEKFQLYRIEADISLIIEQAIDTFRNWADSKGIELSYNSPFQAIPKVYVDPEKIQEALQRLIENAIKFTDEGKVTLSLGAKDQYLIINVIDTGVGISKKDQQLLFNKFYQAGRFSADKPQEQQGTGLGLYIAKSIVENHGGKITVESDKRHGSHFSVYLPLASTQASESVTRIIASEGATASSEGLPRVKERILGDSARG